MLFFYRLRILSYVLANVKNLIVRVFLLSIYAYACGVILLFLSGDPNIPLGSAKYILYYLYKYMKLCYYNWDNLSYGLVIRLIVSLILPYFIYKTLTSVKWKYFFRRLIIRIIAVIRKKRESTLKENQSEKGTQTEKGTQNNYQDKVNAIKNILMHDIEKTIDKRLYDIFIAKRKPEHTDLRKNTE
ncbi:hypothetical protein [Candidatus Mesenet endosymbiont of Agriotes lineatus]|uniref:hypothetical protein n=1 Tax=Candidatus Mesenet endosymbiont of Agriotes lineatus TaxID=3077948 RepID=UPI0030D3B4FA